MKKLSLIIAAIFIFGVANTVSAQRSRAGGISHGAARVGLVSGGNDANQANHVVSVNLSPFALLSIEDNTGQISTGFSFDISPSDLVSDAGAGFNAVESDETFYLQYTSIVSSGANNKISAKIEASTLPSAFKLKAKVSSNPKMSSKKGNQGQGNNSYETIVSTGNGIDVVTGIGSCFTGTASEDGHSLNYELEIDQNGNFNDIVAGNYSATVVYTITEN